VSQEVEYQTERLDHLGIVAGVCQEVGIAEWLDMSNAIFFHLFFCFMVIFDAITNVV
jgi:phage shock protein PspC (stress-responsive transcriptional regulator)